MYMCYYTVLKYPKQLYYCLCVQIEINNENITKLIVL